MKMSSSPLQKNEILHGRFYVLFDDYDNAYLNFSYRLCKVIEHWMSIVSLSLPKSHFHWQLWKRFRGSDKPPASLGPSREYNVDMIPKVFFLLFVSD